MKKNGGPAFPRAGNGGHGMTLRDYFAGQVVVGLFSDGMTMVAVTKRASEEGVTDHDVYARIAYNVADAMLAVREGPA